MAAFGEVEERKNAGSYELALGLYGGRHYPRWGRPGRMISSLIYYTALAEIMGWFFRWWLFLLLSLILFFIFILFLPVILGFGRHQSAFCFLLFPFV